MTPENNSSMPQGKSIPLSGNDPVLEHLKARGLPLTRENYVKMADLQEPLDGEMEGYLLTLPLES